MLATRLLACALAVLAASVARAADRDLARPAFSGGEILVRYEQGFDAPALRVVAQQEGLELVREIPHLRLRQYRLAPGARVEEACDRLGRRPEVRFAEPNYRHDLRAIPTDPRFAEQWSLHDTGQVVEGESGTADADIDWPEAMDLHTSQAVVVVAVVDSGVALDHPDLAGRIWTNAGDPVDGMDNDANGFVDDHVGWDFFDQDASPLDEHGHGTLVASQIAAEIDNAVGLVGVAPQAQIMALRAFDDFGSGGAASTLTFVLSTTYAAEKGAAIINYSAGRIGSFSQLEYDQVAWLDGQGVLLVAAAGNGGPDAVGDDNDVLPHYPSSYDVPNVLSVAASDRTGALADFSNYGDVSVDLAAPGTTILGADVNRSTTYLETFDTGAPGWTVGQNCGSCDNWSLIVGAGGNTWANDSEDQVTGEPLIYLPFADAWMDSPWIPVPVTGPQLAFRSYFEMEAFDIFGIEITADGLFWEIVDFVVGPRATLTDPPSLSADAGIVPAYDLSPYAGQTVKLRFSIITDGFYEADGAYVDDVTFSQVDTFFFDGTQFQFGDGTSFGAPLVSGVAALLMSHRPELTHREVRDAILDSADPVPALSGLVATGGRLNAHAALQFVPEPSRALLRLSGIAALLLLGRRRGLRPGDG